MPQKGKYHGVAASFHFVPAWLSNSFFRAIPKCAFCGRAPPWQPGSYAVVYFASSGYQGHVPDAISTICAESDGDSTTPTNKASISRFLRRFDPLKALSDFFFHEVKRIGKLKRRLWITQLFLVQAIGLFCFDACHSFFCFHRCHGKPPETLAG